ncbi:MAG TPA: multicopper oxidase domain-containing protein [Bryobacteraceae bacterium]|nr:multicopper oxidase domain-containing protein [Bryobacteraceae bacterium]
MSAPAFAQDTKPDATLTIAPMDLELAPGKTVKTLAYNGSVPGPLLRFPEGKPVTIEVQNGTKEPEIAHWHGLWIPSNVDGSAEEGTPMIPAGASARYTFTAQPAGFRWYHTHTMAMRNLNRATYTGQFGFFYIDPKNDPGDYDAEVFLALRGWDPYMSSGGDEEGGLEVAYKYFSINNRALGHGEPVRVKQGQRVMFRILNASATMYHRIALTGHSFLVTALDGYRVPSPQKVEAIEMGPAERVDAVVTMDNPGIWVLGEVDNRTRVEGLGIVIEYAESAGGPRWSLPGPWRWDYTRFGSAQAAAAPLDGKIPLVFKQKFAGSRWVDHWTVNGKEYPKGKPIIVEKGKRYRLIFNNQSGEAHPVHLHRHAFELKSVAGTPTNGILKDVVVVPPWKTIEADFVANNPGRTLFHCHQQMHMDYGFMVLIDYAS